jgi:hypothetical protein
MLQRRLQILIDEPRYLRLQDAARDRGQSVAAVIRSLVDTALPATDVIRREAARSILHAAPMQVPADPRDLRRELDEARDRA